MFTGNINFAIKINVYAIYNRLENPLKQDILKECMYNFRSDSR